MIAITSKNVKRIVNTLLKVTSRDIARLTPRGIGSHTSGGVVWYYTTDGRIALVVGLAEDSESNFVFRRYLDDYLFRIGDHDIWYRTREEAEVNRDLEYPDLTKVFPRNRDKSTEEGCECSLPPFDANYLALAAKWFSALGVCSHSSFMPQYSGRQMYSARTMVRETAIALVMPTRRTDAPEMYEQEYNTFLGKVDKKETAAPSFPNQKEGEK